MSGNGGAVFGPAAGKGNSSTPAAPAKGGAVFGPASGHASPPPAPAQASMFGPSSGAGDPSNPFVQAYRQGGTGNPAMAGSTTPVGQQGHGLAGLAGRALHDAAGAVVGLPGGVLHLGADLGKSAVNAVREAPVIDKIPGVALKQQAGESNYDFMKRIFPIATDVAAPTVGTGRSIGGLAQMAHVAPGHGLADETKAKYSAHPFGSLLSDALGASVVAGPADTLAKGALGEESAAAGITGKVAAATHAVSNLPAKPYEALAGKVADIPAVSDFLQRRAADAKVQDFRSENFQQPAREAVGNVYKGFAPGSQLSPTEQAALVLTQRNELGLIQPAMDKLAPADRAAFIQKFAEAHPSEQVTPEAVSLADKYSKGLLPAEQAARLDKAAASEASLVREPAQANALAGKGMAGGATLSPEQLGFSPLSANLDAATEKAMRNLPRAQKFAEQARARADAMAAVLDQAKADASARLDEQAQAKGERQLASKQSKLQSAVDRQTTRAVTAADRLTSARDLAEAAKAAGPSPTVVDRALSPADRVKNLAIRAYEKTNQAGDLAERGAASTLDTQAAADRTHARFDQTLGNVAETAQRGGMAEGQQVGRLTERQNQAARIARMEARNMGSLTGKLEGLPAEATPADVKASFATGAKLGRLSEKAAATDKAAARAEELVNRIHGKVRAAAQDAALDPANAPARLRPMLYAAQEAVKTLREMGGPNAAIADEITPTLAAIRQQGLDAEHVIGGSDTPKGTRVPRSGVAGEKPTGAQIRRMGNNTEFNAPGQAGLYIKRALEGVKNEFAQKAADPASGLVTGTGGEVGPGMTGADLHAAAAMQGLVPYDPTKSAGGVFFPKGDGNVLPKDVTPETKFMPKAIYDSLSKQEPSIPDPNSAGAKFDRLNTLIRKNPLMLSPSYHLRIATSNAMLAGLAGDIQANPIELAKQIRETSRLLKSGEAPRDLIRNGLFADEQTVAQMRRAGTDQNMAQKMWHGPVEVGKKVSATIDNFSRVMAYVGEKAKGYSDEEAVTRANKAIGNYDQLSPTEQAIIKRVLPIYPWLKQIAIVAGRLGRDHPIASMFALHAASLYDQNQPAGLPSYLRGAIGIGGNKFLPTDLANPFAVVTAPPGGFTNPVIKAPVAALTGLDLNTWKQYTRPPGVNGVPQPQSGALWHNPSELRYVLGGMNPVSKFARDVTLPNVQRWQTGEPKLTKGQETPSNKPPAPLAALGLPLPQQVDLAGNVKKDAKFQQSQIKAAKKYQQQLDRIKAAAKARRG